MNGIGSPASKDGDVGNIQAGKMRALAVSGRARVAQLTEVPTLQELGIAFVDESS